MGLIDVLGRLARRVARLEEIEVTPSGQRIIQSGIATGLEGSSTGFVNSITATLCTTSAHVQISQSFENKVGGITTMNLYSRSSGSFEVIIHRVNVPGTNPTDLECYWMILG